jgi:hypothetical protein
MWFLTSVEFPSDNMELWRAHPPQEAVEVLVSQVSLMPVSMDLAEAILTDVGNTSVAEREPEEEVEIVDDFEADAFADVIHESSIPPALESMVVSKMPLDEVEPLPGPEITNYFAIFLTTLAEVALAHGVHDELVAAIPGILGAERLDVRSLDEALVEGLVTRGLLTRGESGLVVRSDTVVRTAAAWRGALDGAEPDFSACGTAMFDEWSADLVARLAGTPQKVEILRRELRGRGVAAFGLLVEAA